MRPAVGWARVSARLARSYKAKKFTEASKAGVEIRFEVLVTRKAVQALLRLSIKDVNALRDEAMRALELNAPSDLVEEFEDALGQADSIAEVKEVLSSAPETYNRVIIEDTGTGMSEKDLQDAFLVIGTSSRRKDVEAAIHSQADDAPYLGEKGIGRLSAMRLGDTLMVESATADDTHMNLLDIDWSDFEEPETMLGDVKIEPEQGAKKKDPSYHGTKLVIGRLQNS